MKKLLTLTLAILLAFSCLALTACMPSKPEKAKANLEDAVVDVRSYQRAGYITNNNGNG